MTKAVTITKMAAKILDNVLSSFLSIDSLIQWLSNTNSSNEVKIFSSQYECSQVEFVSFFLLFLRDQCSRNFQVYNADTPGKNSHPKVSKTPVGSEKKNFSHSLEQENLSGNNEQLYIDSSDSFPSLSSSSFKTKSSDTKYLETTVNSSLPDIFGLGKSEKKIRRIKLVSENPEKTMKDSNKSSNVLENVEMNHSDESKIFVSTPKNFKNSSLPLIDCLDTSDIIGEVSSRAGFRFKLKNQKMDSSTSDIVLGAPKSKSFGGDSYFISKENKSNTRMSLGDFILNDASLIENKKEKKNKFKKKINLVKVGNEDFSTFVEKTHDKIAECSKGNNSEKLIQPEEDLNKLLHVKNKNKEFLSCSSEREAELELVTHTAELKILSQIYSCLINENYCQNIMIELCFIISLLVIQGYNKKHECEISSFNIESMEEQKLFASIHNCVFFAVETLWLQKNLLLLLNFQALKLLSENKRIEKFNGDLKNFLVTAYSKKKSNEEVKRQNLSFKHGMQGNVSFQYETDNRENFTSDISFHSFRKQRDLFYNILATWETNHSNNGWIFSVGLGSKIKSLLSISSDPINLLHLARLFRNQLIMSCCGENQAEEDINEEILQLLPSADPNKILRLRARLTSSPKRQGPCPLPDFTGNQEFYKDFILNTVHSGFHEHLKNSLCDEILRLDDTELLGEVEDSDSSLDEQAQEQYFQCTNILRTLAKFLGFVEFLPYRGEKYVSSTILNIHCSVRNNTLPLFDAVSYLKSAITKNKLTLTIPWMVSYLSMIDSYSANLNFYQKVWQILIVIYKQLTYDKTPKNTFFLKLTLGWMFQLPNFPTDQFYSVLDDCNKKSSECLSLSVKQNECKIGLDSFDFVEENVLYTVCPYLNEINVILKENAICNVKHIRPVTTKENSVSNHQISKQIELKLEGNFLHNQSSSTKKTIEFVTERIASITIKHLIHKVLPEIKEVLWRRIENLYLCDMKESEIESEILSESCFKEFQEVCERKSWEISWKHSAMALKALLSDELQGSVADTCAKIVTRQAAEKVERWIRTHITLFTLKKEFASLIKKKFAKKWSDDSFSFNTLDTNEIFASRGRHTNKNYETKSRSTRRREDHKVESWPASATLKYVREVILKVYEGECCVADVEQAIDETISTINHRRDIIPAAEKALLSLVTDLIICYGVFSNNDFSSQLLKKFTQLLKSTEFQTVPQNNLERLVCPRNITMILIEARNREKAWNNLSSLLILLVELDLITKEQAEHQLLSLLRQNWNKEDGLQYSKLISFILNQYSKSHGCDKFSLLLEYILESLNDDYSKVESSS